jgi:ferredoxin
MIPSNHCFEGKVTIRAEPIQRQLPGQQLESNAIKGRIRLQSTPADGYSDDQKSNQQQQQHGHTIQVMYEGRSCAVFVKNDETILAALEREQVSDRLSLPNHMIPSDCRRGNCLTCTGKLVNVQQPSSHLRQSHSSVVTDDGLAPSVSEFLKEAGFVVTCSSRVVGDGVQLVLGENHNVWMGLYQERIENDHTQIIGWAAMARTRRMGDERNVPRWKKETEAVFKDGKPKSER